MNLPPLGVARQQSFESQFQPLTRQDKASDFISSALTPTILMGAEALNSLASSGKVATSGAQALSSTAGTVSSSANIASGILGGLQLAMNWGKSSPAAGASSGIALGASIGTMCLPGIGTVVGAGIGALVGGAIGCITAGKHKDQKVRDSVREALANMGVLNSEYQLQLANGSLYDMGKDGGARSELGGRRPYEVDFSNPLAQYAVGWMNPIIALLAPGNKKIATDFTGYFANAALSNAKDLNDVRQNIGSFLRKFGISNDALAKGIVQMAQSGLVDQHTARVWIGGIQQRMNPNFKGDFELSQKSTVANDRVNNEVANQ